MVIQSVQRALGILSLFSHCRPNWGITDISTSTGLAKGTVHNLVHTLVQAGFLKQDPETRKYCLGHSIFALGAIMSATLEINQKAESPAHRLAAATGLVCRVAIWDVDAALVTLNVTPRHTEVLARQIGPRVVAYCSAVGRVLLAHLDPEARNAYFDQVDRVRFTPRTIVGRAELEEQIQQSLVLGYATNNQELAMGYASLASAIFTRGGSLAAAISLTGQPEEVLGDNWESIVHQLRSTANEISRYMGYFQAAPDTTLAHHASN